MRPNVVSMCRRPASIQLGPTISHPGGGCSACCRFIDLENYPVEVRQDIMRAAIRNRDAFWGAPRFQDLRPETKARLLEIWSLEAEWDGVPPQVEYSRLLALVGDQ